MKPPTQVGSMAESRASVFLRSKGYQIVGRNWKTKYCEIDLIAYRNRAIYFVEVKYRSRLNAGDGFDAITTKKLQHMVRAAEIWVRSKQWRGKYSLAVASATGPSAEHIDFIVL